MATIFCDHPGSRPWGTTTQVRLTLLDAWPDANETSHGRSLPLGEVLAARSSVPQPFFIAVSQPFLSRSWAEMVENWVFELQ